MAEFKEMINYLESSNVKHFENQFVVCKDFRYTLSVIKNRVFSRIASGVNPKNDLICKTEKKNIEMFYNDIKELEDE